MPGELCNSLPTNRSRPTIMSMLRSILRYRFELSARIDWLESIKSLMIDRVAERWSFQAFEIRSRVWTNLDLNHPRGHQARLICNATDSSLEDPPKMKTERMCAVSADRIYCFSGIPDAAVSRAVKYRNAASSGVLRQCVAAGEEG